MEDLHFALCGAGFWARPQLAAWGELPGTRCVAICDPVRERARSLAASFGVPGVWDDAGKMLAGERLDFMDITAGVEAHPGLVHLAAARGLAAICQKPLAPTLIEAAEMVSAMEDAGAPLLVHENWRWQEPIRQVKARLNEGHIGSPFRARIDMVSGFPVFSNQPSLRDLPRFLLMDLGSHILDVVRFLFGEADSVYCRTHRVHNNIRGEDVATVVLGHGPEMTVTCSMAYAENFLEHDRFPETFVFVEGELGSLELGPDYWVRETTAGGTWACRHPPPRYAWADPAYDVVQSSLVPCCADLLGALRGGKAAETTGADNLKTARLVFAAYRSAADGAVVDPRAALEGPDFPETFRQSETFRQGD